MLAPRKKTFTCNQHAKVPPSQTVVVDDIPSSPVVASSRRKIEGEGSNITLDGDSGILDNDSSSSSHYILIDSDVISELFTLVGCCPECAKSGIVFSNDFEK